MLKFFLGSKKSEDSYSISLPPDIKRTDEDTIRDELNRRVDDLEEALVKVRQDVEWAARGESEAVEIDWGSTLTLIDEALK